MNSLIIGIVGLLAGILINIFMLKLGVVIFRKNSIITKIILRFIGIFLVINSVSLIFKNL